MASGGAVETKFDYLIVLGYRLEPNGDISETLKLRLDKALEVIEQTGFASKIVVSGGRPRDDIEFSEAERMANYLEANGVSAYITKEGFSKDTFGNVGIFKAKLSEPDSKQQKRGLRLRVVTSSTHVERAGIIFDWFFNREIKEDGYRITFTAAKNPLSMLPKELSYELRGLWILYDALSCIPDGKLDLIDRTMQAIKALDHIVNLEGQSRGLTDLQLQKFVDGRIAKFVVPDRNTVSMLRSESTGKQKMTSKG